MPNFWHRTHEKDQHLGVRRGEMPASRKKHHNKLLRELERQNSDMDHPTDVEEVWFAGCHTGTVPSLSPRFWAEPPMIIL